jgi:hypothetical protein
MPTPASPRDRSTAFCGPPPGTTRYREPGLGAPLAASLAPLPGETRNDLLLPELTIGVTAIPRLPGSRTGLDWPPLEGTLEVHIPEMTDTVDVAGQAVSLESEPTAVFAYSLADSPVWGQEYTRFSQAISFGTVEEVRRILLLHDAPSPAP